MLIGDRLREERERLGMSQPKFAALAQTTKQTLFSWESGKTAPDSVQLVSLAAAGVDVQYVLVGERLPPGWHTNFQMAAAATLKAIDPGLAGSYVAMLPAISEAAAKQRAIEALLLEHWRRCSPADRETIIGLAARLAKAAGASKSGVTSGTGARQEFHASVGQAATGNIVNTGVGVDMRTKKK